MDPDVRIRRLADIKKQLGLDEDGVFKHLVRTPPTKSYSVANDLNIISPKLRFTKFRSKKNPMSSVDDTHTATSSRLEGGPKRPSPKPRRRPPCKPLAPYKPKVPMIPPTRNGSVSPVPDTGYEPIELCEANSSTIQKQPDTSDNLADRPKMNTPDPLGTKPRPDKPKGTPPTDPLWDRPRLRTPTGSPTSPTVPLSTSEIQEGTSSQYEESYAVAVIVGEPPPMEQYSEVSQRGLKPPPSSLDSSCLPVTGQVDPDTEYNITTHLAANRMQPVVPMDEYSYCSNSPRHDMPNALGYTEINILPDTQLQLVHQQAEYSTLGNSASEDGCSHAPKDDSCVKALPTSQNKPPILRPKPNVPPKPSNLRKSLDCSDTSSIGSVSPMSPSYSAQAAHPTPRYETCETLGDDVEKRTAPSKPIACARSSGQVLLRKDLPSTSANSLCEVNIDEIIRRQAVKDKQKEKVVLPRYEDVDLKEVQENASEVESMLLEGWEEPIMPEDDQEQQEIMDVINSYRGTSTALRLEDMDSAVPFGEMEDRASPVAQPSSGSRPSSVARQRSTDSSELDDERKGDSRPRRKAPLPPVGQRSSPIVQKEITSETQPCQSLTLGRLSVGSGDQPGVYEFRSKRSVPISPGLKTKFGNLFRKKKEPLKSFSAMPVSMETKARSSTLPNRRMGKPANPVMSLPVVNLNEDEKDAEFESALPDAFAYSIVTISEVRKSSPSQVRRRTKKGKKGDELRKSRSMEHLDDMSKNDIRGESGLPESPLVSESLDVESHIYATVNKSRHVPPQAQKTPPPIAAKPSPRHSQADENKMVPSGPSVPPPLATKPLPWYPQANENRNFPPQLPAAEPPVEGPENLANNDVADESDKSKEDLGRAQEGGHPPQVKRRPVYAVVVKSGEQMDVTAEGESASKEIAVSGSKEGGASLSNTVPSSPKNKKCIPVRPSPYGAEPILPLSQPPSHPPPIHTSSSKSASKYAHLIKSAPPSHPAPKPPTHRVSDLSHLKNTSPPAHPPPMPPGGPRPKPTRSRSEDNGIPVSDPIYEALDEDDVSDSIGPLPTLKQKYPMLKPKHKPAPPPPNIKKAKSLDSPTSKGGSLGQSSPHVDVTPPHGTPSQSPQHRDGTGTSSGPQFLFSAGRITSFIEVGAETPVSPSISSSTASSALEPNDSDMSSDWDPSSPEEEEDEREKSDSQPKSKVYYIVQEILHTERTFVRGLDLLHKDFRSHMMSANKAHEKQVVTEEMLTVILSNIGSLWTINTGLLAELEERIAKWDSNPRIGDIFVKNAPFLKLYSEYIGNFDNALKTLDELQKKNPLFAQVLREFEGEPQCNNLPIAGYLLETVQRIPRYKLLLADYMKHLPEDSDDRSDSEKALGMISSVAYHINDTIRQMDNFKKIVEVSKKLIGDVGDSLISPHRRLLKEGELLKSSRKEKQPRMFFLFTDLLIYASAIPPANTTFRVIKRIPLSGMKVDILDDPEMKYGFQIISTCKSFRLDASNAEERNQWIQSFETAIKDHTQRMLSREKNRKSIMMLSPDSDVAALGHYAPPWLPDSSVSMCQLCSIHFTMTRRRHHCRACGMIFCGDCSDYMAPLAYKGSKMCRVCQSCYEQLEGPVVGVESTDGGTLKNVHRRSRPLRTSKKNISMPSVLSEVKGRDQNAVISDYLFCRLPNRSKQFKKKWFVVYNLVLYEFKRHEDVSAQRSITLPSYQVVSPVPGHDALIFCLEHPGAGKFFFKASNEDQLDRWVTVLRKAVRGEE